MSIAWQRISFCMLLCVGLLLQAAAHAELRVPFYEAVRGKQVVYVLGTLHVGRADFYPLRPVIESALRKSDRLYVEIDQEEPGVKQELSRAMLCDHPCLKETLSEAEWNTLTERLGRQEAAIREIGKIRPWAAAIVLSMADFTALGLDIEQGVEKYVSEQAGNGKAQIGLETVGEQLRLFTEMPPEEQKEMLVQWLNMTPKERLDVSRDLVTLWMQGDADALHAWYKKVEIQYSSSPEVAEAFDQIFLVARNRVFINRLLSQVGNSPGPFFLAVGALHLGGPDGVLALLKKKGFKVKAK